MTGTRRFEISTTADPAEVLAGLIERGVLHEVESTEVERRFYDTPDGRLERSGTTLEIRSSVEYPAQRSLLWSEGSRVLASERIESSYEPRFDIDLPTSAPFDGLRELIEMRAFVAGASVRSRLSTAAHLDAEEKTTARVRIDLPQLPDGRALPAVLEVTALRGYESECRRLLALIDADDAFRATEATTAQHARTALALPAFVPAKFSLDLDDEATAVEVWRVVLQELLDIMTANYQGTVLDIDSEYLHDFRVAVRRTRSVLQEGRGVLHPDARAHFRAGFKWLGDITTPTRDADVHLLDLPNLMGSLPADYAAALQPLEDLLVARQRDCQTTLAVELRSPQRAILGSEWAEYLAGRGLWSEPDPKHMPDADRLAVNVVGERVRRAHARLIRDGRAIDADSPAVALHDLRKDAKRLRYLLECFGSLFPSDTVAIAVRPLKSLQDVLGEFQDTEVQAHALVDLGRQLDDAGAATETILAMGGAIEQLNVRGVAARSGFAARFGAFDADHVHVAFDQLTRHRKKRR